MLNKFPLTQFAILLICMGFVSSQNAIQITEEDKFQQQLVTAKVALTLIICIVGLFGNMITIFVILVLKEFKKSVTHWYVLQLAFADSLFLLTLPFKVSEDLNNEFIYPEWMCKAKETILFLNYYASVLFLMIMSIDRYIAICFTFSVQLQKLRKTISAYIISASTWIICLLCCIPVMLYSFKVGANPYCKCSFVFPSENNKTADCLKGGFQSKAELEKCLALTSHNRDQYCTDAVLELNINVTDDAYSPYVTEIDGGLDLASDYIFEIEIAGNVPNNPVIDASNTANIDPSCNYRDQPPGWTAFIAFNFAVMFVVPLIVMIFCYGLIVRHISVTHKASTNNPSTSSFTQSTTAKGKNKKRKKSASKSEKDRRRVTIMCAALVACFVICWLPFNANHLAKIVGIKTENPRICVVLPVVGSLLAYLNSALNPYLYSFLGTNLSRRWKMLKKSRGFQHFVSMAAWKRGDNSGGGNYQGTSRMNRKENASQNSKHYSGSYNIQNQLPTMITKASSTKYNESQGPLPTQSANQANDVHGDHLQSSV